MRTNVALGILALALCVPGCELTALTVEALVYETVFRMDDCCQHTRNCLLARVTWNRYREANPETRFSDDFACGFRHGFADYVYYGGSVDPPPVPPRCYWKYWHQLPDKGQAIHEWQEGYRAGATIAMEAGYRQQVVVPVVAPIPPGTPRVPGSLPAPPGPGPAPVVSGPGADDVLPPPRPLQPAQGESVPRPPAPAPAALQPPRADIAPPGAGDDRAAPGAARP